MWLFDDLTGNILDDTYYIFFLQNTFPYLPAEVYHYPDGTAPWNNPIQLLANGTMPVDVFFDSSQVYRIEVRQGQTQSDPLIYLIENYIPAGGGSTPISSVALATDNQITNPQFSLINFSSPYTLTGATNPDPIEVAPGWFLNLTGTGNVTIEREALNNAQENPTNAPYALHLTLSGSWTDPYLSQRFNQNGMLWANKTVSSSVTARIEGAPQNISATLYDSNAELLAQVLFPVALNDSFNEYTGYGTLSDSTNPDLPPAAWVEYRLALPTSVDIYLTSIQLVASNLPTTIAYNQDSIERQQDYTFHYYRDSLLTQPKESLLTGWDFGLNPWQFTTTASTTLAAQCAYTADQTIIYQQAGGSEIATARGTADENYAFEVKAIGNNSRFAVIQYIAPDTVRDVWSYVLSSLVRAYISSPTHGSAVRFKMRLIYRASLPSTIGAAEPILSWTGSNDPTFSAGWTAIAPENDPVYTFGAQGESYTFERMQLPASSNAAMTLGIVLYTLDPIVETATADRILFERISLCHNDFAIDGQLLSFDETLSRCQYYFEKSKEQGVLSTTAGANNALMRTMRPPASGANTYLLTNSFGIEYLNIKNITPVTSLYTEGGLIDNVTGYTVLGGSGVQSTGAISATTAWVALNGSDKGIQYRSITAANYISTVAAVTEHTEAYISFHYEADARLGS